MCLFVSLCASLFLFPCVLFVSVSVCLRLWVCLRLLSVQCDNAGVRVGVSVFVSVFAWFCCVDVLVALDLYFFP